MATSVSRIAGKHKRITYGGYDTTATAGFAEMKTNNIPREDHLTIYYFPPRETKYAQQTEAKIT